MARYHANTIVIDIDDANGAAGVDELAAAYRLPRPVLIADPYSGRSHAVFRLASPVLVSGGGKMGPRFLLDLAGRMLAAALRGTVLPHRTLIKSPWGLELALIGARLRRTPTPATPAVWDAYEEFGSPLMWLTVPGDHHAFELREIIDALAGDFGAAVTSPAARRHFRRRRAEPSALGRNCALFDLTRWWAYDLAERDGGAIQGQAERVNAGFPNPLPANEVAATARSIARFMQAKYRGGGGVGGPGGGRRGRDREAGGDLPPDERKALAGRATAAARKTASADKIRAATEALQAKGERVTQAAVATLAGVSLLTVKRHWHSIPMVSDARYQVVGLVCPLAKPLAGLSTWSAPFAGRNKPAFAVRR